jgi:uncharacterized membrane-anchored protein YhcB (DUF1043 family)
MTILGAIALIVLVVLGVMVLRVQSDPLENESVRKYLADTKRAKSAPSLDAQNKDSPPPGPVE